MDSPMQVFDYKPTMTFVDRSEALQLIERALEAEVAGHPEVLVFHGVGGMGKSALSKNLAGRSSRDRSCCADSWTIGNPGEHRCPAGRHAGRSP